MTWMPCAPDYNEVDPKIGELHKRIAELTAQRNRLRRAVRTLQLEVGRAGFYEDPMDAPQFRSEQARGLLDHILQPGDMTGA